MGMSLAYKNDWQRKYRRKFYEENGFSTKANYSVGGIRAKILLRDGNKCVKCQMTDREHKEKYGRPITIDHKDKNRKNNSPENLQTLCLSCHGSKDITPSLIKPRFAKFLPTAIELRKTGATYQNIADRFSFSSATVWKYLKTVKGGSENGKRTC